MLRGLQNCPGYPAVTCASQGIPFCSVRPEAQPALIIQGALGAQIAPDLEPGENLVTSALYFVYDYPSQPDQSLSIQERDTLIRARYASGVSQADLARQFGISYQRVHQIVRGETR
jgi:hypothetical protein